MTQCNTVNGCIQKRNRSLETQWALALDWLIFLDLMEYANQIQELTEQSVSDCDSGCTQSLYLYCLLMLNKDEIIVTLSLYLFLETPLPF